MTIRSQINKNKRKISLTAYAGFLVFIAGSLLSRLNRTFFILALVGFGVLFTSMIYAFFRVPCPRCNNSWGYIALYSGGPFSLSKKVKFCPYCGVDLDSDLHVDSSEV